MGQISDVDLRLLRVFKVVAECRGFTSASTELNIGVPTISRHIKELENRLGLRLCRRGRSGFSLTAEGEVVYEDMQKLLTALHDFRNRINHLHDRTSGSLHMAVFDKTAGNPKARISQALASFTQMAPQVHINMHVGAINTIERGIIGGRFQVAVVPEHRPLPNLHVLPLFRETMHLYCAPSHPLYQVEDRKLSWKELSRYPYAGLGYHSPNMEVSHKRSLSRAATGFDQEAIAILIISGQFLGFLPSHYGRRFVSDGLLRTLNAEKFVYYAQFSAIARKNANPPPEVSLLLQCLEEAHKHSNAANSG